MEHEFESAPRDNTRRTIVVRSITRLAVFILKLLYAGCVTFCRRHTPVCTAVVVPLSIGGGDGHGVTALPLQSQQAATLPMWRPARRVDARRYVKDQNNLPSKAPNTMPSNQITTEITFWRLDFATARTTVLSVRSPMK